MAKKNLPRTKVKDREEDIKAEEEAVAEKEDPNHAALSLYSSVKKIVDHGHDAQVRRKKNGELQVYEVRLRESDETEENRN